MRSACCAKTVGFSHELYHQIPYHCMFTLEFCLFAKKIVPQGWFLDECAWCAGAYLGAYQWAAPLLAVGEKRWRWQGGRTKYVKSAYNKAESSYLWGVCWFQQVNRSHVCCPYTGVFHCFPATSYNKGMMIATGCLIKALFMVKTKHTTLVW